MDWCSAIRRENGKDVVIECRTCTHMELNSAFNPPLMVCASYDVRPNQHERPACIVARSPVGKCSPNGTFWKPREDK